MSYLSFSSRPLAILVGFHIFVIALSNYLVQFPFDIYGIHNTWGAFSFPLVYLATDLTVRLYGNKTARIIIFCSMIPALIVSYAISTLFQHGHFQTWSSIVQWNDLIFRISIASFAAYLCGQMMDIIVFSKLRRLKQWWIAPVSSNVLGGIVDTFLFFAIAFHMSSDTFMSAHWPQIALSDYMFKLFVGLIIFLPAYGILLNFLVNYLKKPIVKYELSAQS